MNDKNITEEQKTSTIKWLAVVGFATLIVVMVWLAIQVVSLVPNAFSSLASIADSVYNNDTDKEINISTQKSVVAAGEAFTVSWDERKAEGSYFFSYECADGVTLETRIGNEINALACDTPLEVTSGDELDLRIASEKERFADVVYNVTFVPDNSSAPEVSQDETITIVNASISTVATNEDTEEEATDTEETTDTTVEEETTEVVTTTPTTPSTPTTPTYVEEVIYITPVSDPNGFIDLQVTFVAVGIERNGRFIASPEIAIGEKGSIQFEVKNIGTKTATDWDFEADLPAGINYTSQAQKELKPNEKALYTLGFEGVTQTGTESFSIEVDADGDVQNSNDKFLWAVKIVD